MLQIFDKESVKHLRIPFSFFLMPVYFLALSQSIGDWDSGKLGRALLIFIVLHLFIYPASNAYNSYMDQDEGSIGGIKNPTKASRNVFLLSLWFDLAGVLLSLFMGWIFACGIVLYLLVSRAYSYKGIRLKKMPIIGFLSVVIFQGAFTFAIVWAGINQSDLSVLLSSNLVYPMIASSLMIAGVYPLTQIYQHEQDKASGDVTISYLLGYRGTFVSSIAMFLGAGILFFLYFSMRDFILFQLFLTPVAVYFVRWMLLVWKNNSEANFEHTMRMNLIASSCMNACFVTFWILNIP